MMNFIPILSLNTVVFPTEVLNLHLSRKSEVQLIKDQLEAKKNLGLVLKESAVDFPVTYGTLAQASEVVKMLKNGSIHVRLKGIRSFRILEIKKQIPDKPYWGAIVDYPPPEKIKIDKSTEALIASEVKRLYKLMQLEKKFPAKADRMASYNFAHKIGFTLKQEYELLTIHNEIQRMEYIRRHLNAMMPVVTELEQMKKRIQMNGHFRNLS